MAAAYLSGLEQAHTAGLDLATIRSVASFFISRVDTEVDARLDHLGTPEADALKGSAAIANARQAHQAHEQLTASERWQRLARLARGRSGRSGRYRCQEPAYPDTKYVAGLIALGTVNAMPGAALEAFADHGQVSGGTVTGGYDGSRSFLGQLAAAGIVFDDVTEYLERGGLSKFGQSWSELGAAVAAGMDPPARIRQQVSPRAPIGHR